jgi:hypothetical protein
LRALMPRLDDIIEVFDFYDEPVLFVCRNPVGTAYLVMLADLQTDSKSWLCVPMSETRFRAVRRGDLDFYTAFRDSEARYAARVTRSAGFVGIIEEFEEVEIARLADDDLPAPGERVQGKAELETPLEPIVSVARAERADIVRMRLSMSGGRRGASSLLLGSVLTTTQRSLNAIGQSLPESRPKRTPRGAANPHELGVVATFTGSFGIEFRAAATSDLLYESPIVPVLGRFFDVLRASHDRSASELEDLAKQLKRRSVSNIRTFMAGLLGNVEQVDTLWGRPNETEPRRALLTAGDADFCLAVLSRTVPEEPDRFVVRGRLVAFNTRTKHYEIFDEEEMRKFSGRTDDTLWARREGFTSNQVYWATIEETAYEDPTGEVDSKFRLIDLQPLA